MGKYYLILLFLGICLVLILRILVESTNYTSLDSQYYLKVADNILEGKGLLVPETYPFDKKAREVYFAMWPAGYPAMIALVSSLAGISTLVASKIVNIIFLGLIFFLLWEWGREYAWFPALYFCSFGMLEVYSYTWTEGPFLFFVLYLCHLIHKAIHGKFSQYFFCKLAICLLSLFLLRYAGLIYFFFTGAVLLYFLLKKDRSVSRHFFLGLLLASFVVVGYFFWNHQETGYFTGGNRFTSDIAFVDFLLLLIQGFLNEIFIIRNYYFSGYTDYLFLVLLFLQLVLFTYLFSQRRYLFKPFPDWGSISALVLCAGLFYLPFIILLSYVFYFDPFNYRILAPFSMPIFVGILLVLTHQENRKYFEKTSKWIAAFMLISLLLNLPKQFIFEYFVGS